MNFPGFIRDLRDSKFVSLPLGVQRRETQIIDSSVPLAHLISSDVLTDDLPLLQLHVFAARRDRSVNYPETSTPLIAW